MNQPADNDWITGNVKLLVNGKPLEMQMTVPAKPVKLSRMLPVLHALTNSFVDAGVQATEKAGEKISCRKGCGACCRQPVPLAEVEAFQIAELVESLPEPRRAEVKKRFAEGAAHFRKIKWFERIENCPPDSPETVQQLGLEYFKEGVACPFLAEESCSIHTQRPIACREYLVTSPAENCAEPKPKGVKGIELMFKPSVVLREMSGAESMKKTPFVMLINALEWAEKNDPPQVHKTGEQWMADFFRRLTKSEIPKPPEKKIPRLD